MLNTIRVKLLIKDLRSVSKNNTIDKVSDNNKIGKVKS